MDQDNSHLPRLSDDSYNGFAFIHWTFTIRHRQTGWLDESFHGSFRELLLHSLSRYQAVCPIYCLMPDHAHLLILGWSHNCRQRHLIRFLRRHTNTLLRRHSPPYEWQKQAHDNILREEDRARNAFQKVANYIAENPVRAGLVTGRPDWEYADALVPGYPELHFGLEDYWRRFWRIYLAALPDDYRPPVDRKGK